MQVDLIKIAHLPLIDLGNLPGKLDNIEPAEFVLKEEDGTGYQTETFRSLGRVLRGDGWAVLVVSKEVTENEVDISSYSLTMIPRRIIADYFPKETNQR